MDALLSFLLIGLVVVVSICGLLALLELSRIFDLRTWFKNKWRNKKIDGADLVIPPIDKNIKIVGGTVYRYNDKGEIEYIAEIIPKIEEEAKK